LIPESTDKLSPWKTKNYYFYEITNYKGELYIQLYFYCKNLSQEMKEAYIHLADLLHLGDLTKGYKLYYKTSSFQNNDNDTAEGILSQLDALLSGVQSFEKQISENWEVNV